MFIFKFGFRFERKWRWGGVVCEGGLACVKLCACAHVCVRVHMCVCVCTCVCGGVRGYKGLQGLTTARDSG